MSAAAPSAAAPIQILVFGRAPRADPEAHGASVLLIGPPLLPSGPVGRRARFGRAKGRDGRRELAHVGEALCGVLLEAAEDRGLELRGQIAPDGARRRGRLDVHLVNEVGVHLGVEGQLARDELVEDHAERPDVAPGVGQAGRSHLLRRHVERRAEDGRCLRELHARLGRIDPARVLRDAEVEHLDRFPAVGRGREEEVRGLEIPVHDAGRVGLGHGLARVEDVVDRVGDGLGAALLEEVVEVAALEELHDHEGRAARELADIEDARDVLALEAHRSLGLAEEAGRGVGHGRREKELDGDALV
jgi:hypothetical protein